MTIITDAQFQSIGFNLVKTEGLVKKYIYLQYYLTYDTVTGRVCVTYGRDQVTYDYRYVSIVDSFSQLITALVRNMIIDPPVSMVC